MVIKKTVAVLFLAMSCTGVQANDVANVEIDHLIDAVAQSGCTFIRNGKRHESAAAAEHLRMKTRRAKRHAKTAEMFIERLASKSSMSGKLYYLECDDRTLQETGAWLTVKLESFRASAASSPSPNRDAASAPPPPRGEGRGEG